jgi:hypothetical protein
MIRSPTLATATTVASTGSPVPALPRRTPAWRASSMSTARANPLAVCLRGLLLRVPPAVVARQVAVQLRPGCWVSVSSRPMPTSSSQEPEIMKKKFATIATAAT